VTRAYEPELTVPQMCRLGRAAADLVRTAAGLERALARCQQMPVPFFGTVLADEVDVAVVDAGWGGRTTQPEAESADVEAADLTAGTAAAGMAGTGPAMTEVGGVGVGAAVPMETRPAVTLGAAGENAELEAMNRENAPAATAARGVGAPP